MIPINHEQAATNKEIKLDDLGYDANLVSLEAIKVDIIQSIKQRFNASGLLEFEIMLKSDKELDIAYKVVWIDEYGSIFRHLH